MDLKTYYKNHIYDLGYNDGYEKKKRILSDDIYYNDEMDYILCADYYGCYVGGLEDWTEEDKKFLAGLGFEPEDFEND